MATVILFGGGDAGGLIITATGVRPIPPFDPAVLWQIKALSGLVAAIEKNVTIEAKKKLAPLTLQVTNLVVEQVEAVLGPIDSSVGLIYQDDDGGFTCGSTGKPPIPIPWPPRFNPTVGELLREGIVDQGLIRFIEVVHEKGIDLKKALSAPAKVAKELGVTLSKKAADDLELLAKPSSANLKDPIEREIVEFFHKVLADGRYLRTWAQRPYEAATGLKAKLSDEATNRIIAGGLSSSYFDPGSVMNPVAVAVAVAVVIMLVDRPAEFIDDRSQIQKF